MSETAESKRAVLCIEREVLHLYSATYSKPYIPKPHVLTVMSQDYCRVEFIKESLVAFFNTKGKYVKMM